MADPHQPLATLLQKDPSILKSLMSWSMGHTGNNETEAEDLLSQTLVTAFETDRRPWDSKVETVHAYLGSILNGHARNRVRSTYMSRRADLDEANPPPVPSTADPEGLLLRSGSERRREDIKSDIRADLAGNPIPIAVLDHTEKGVKGNDALAQAIGCSVAEVRAAKQMIRDRARKVVAKRPSSQGVG